MQNDDLLKLENQLCFPLYAASRLVTRLYQPLLEAHGLTYPQYIVLLILWEQDGLTVSEIGDKAMLSSNTLTPLLKRMQSAKLVERARSEFDERKVIIKLTEKGHALKSEVACIPMQLLENSQIDIEKAKQLKSLLDQLINKLA